LDTGAASSEICFDSYTSTFNSIGSKKSSGAFSSDILDLIQVPNVSIGPIKKENFIIRRQMKDAKRQYNLIGMDILKGVCCHFMFNSETVIVNPAIDESPNFIPLVLGSKFHPYVNLK